MSIYRKMVLELLREICPDHPSLIEKDGELHFRKGWVVHHINGNHFDNRLDNLSLLNDSEHKSYHLKGLFHDEEWNKKVSEAIKLGFLEGRKTWNFGLTKETDPRVAQYVLNGSLTRKGSHRAPHKEDCTCAPCMNRKGLWHSEWNKGRTPWNKGLTKETDERVASYGKLVSETKKLGGRK